MVSARVGILGAGQAGSTLARAAIAAGYDVVIANSRGPETLEGLVRRLGPRARAASAADAAAADFAVLAFPYAPAGRPPAEQLAGKVVLDINNDMAWRDGPRYAGVAPPRRRTEPRAAHRQPAARTARHLTRTCATAVIPAEWDG